MPPHECQKPKEKSYGPKSFRTEYFLSGISNKVEGLEKVFKEMKEDVSTVNQTVNSYSLSIID